MRPWTGRGARALRERRPVSRWLKSRAIAGRMRRELLWDHDGVLVDTEGLYHRATREMLAECGVELDDELYRQLLLVQGTGAWHLVRGKSEAEIAQLQRRRNARYVELITS